MWEHFCHQADIGVRGIGGSIEEAFEEAAIAMMAVICNPANVAGAEEIEITCEGPDIELLFADWLNAIVYEIARRKMLFSSFKVHIEGDKLSAKAWGEAIDPYKHETAVEVKAATYMQLKVERSENGQWFAQCVVDV